MGEIGSKRGILAFGFCLLLLAGVMMVPARGISAPYTDKKIGPWVGLAERSISPATYVQNVFNQIPYYSVAMIQTGVNSPMEGLDWANSVGIEASRLNKPEIEISVIYGFNQNVRDEANWIAFQTVVNTLKAGQPAIKYVGAEGEFWNCSSCSGAEVKAYLDRVRSIVEPAGFQMLNWLWTASYAPNDPNYPSVGGTSFPTWCDPGFVAANYYTEDANFVGIELGVTAGKTDCSSVGGSYASWLADKNKPCGCDWTQELVNWVIDIAHTKSATTRHLNLFAGPMPDPSTGNPSRDTAYYWSDDFRNWVWQRQQMYSEFTWVGKFGGNPLSGSPKSYLDFVFRNASQASVLLPEITWKLFNSSQEIAYPPGTYTLDSYKTYMLKTYYAGYLIKENQISILNRTVDVRLSLFQHEMVPRGQIAFDKPLSAFTLLQEDSDLLTFTASSSFVGHLMVVKSPRAPHYVSKDGATYANWSFDPGDNVTVITSQTLGSWAISFAAPPPPPQPPPLIFLPRGLFPYDLLAMGFIIGFLPFMLAFLARRRDLRYKVPTSR